MNAETPSLDFRIVDPGLHRDLLLETYRHVMKGSADEQQFKWKYEDCSEGPMIVGTAWDVGRDPHHLAGAFSAYPRLFFHDGRVVKVFQDADAMVDEAYRGSGLFRKLTDLLNAEIASQGAPFHFGYSNSQSSPRLGRRSDVRMLKLSQSYAFPIGFANAAATHLRLSGHSARAVQVIGRVGVGAWNRMHGYARSGGLALEPVDRFDDLPLAWSRENAEHYRFFPARDKEFLNWRAVDVPAVLKAGTMPFWITEASRRIGYCVLYADVSRNVLKLIDVLCEQPVRQLARCVAAIRAFAIAGHYDVVTTNVAGALHQHALLASGFWRVSDVVSYLIVTDHKLMEAVPCDGSFWLQLPIDRDNFDY